MECKHTTLKRHLVYKMNMNLKKGIFHFQLMAADGVTYAGVVAGDDATTIVNLDAFVTSLVTALDGVTCAAL